MTTWVQAPVADAVISARSGTPDAPWAALVEFKPHGEATSICSGALVAPGWVLTAAHCVIKYSISGQKLTYTKHKASSFGIYFGSKGEDGKQYRADEIKLRKITLSRSGFDHFDNDVALIHLTKSTSREPLWLLQRSGLATSGDTTRGYGFGDSDSANQGNGAAILRAQRDINQLLPNCAGIFDSAHPTTDGVACAAPASILAGNVGYSVLTHGDSGAPVTLALDGGNRVEAFVLSLERTGGPAYGLLNVVNVGETVYNRSTSSWIRKTVGIPHAVPGHIVRGPSGKGYLVDGDGILRRITSSSVLSCLKDHQHKVDKRLSNRKLALLPKWTSKKAAC